MNPVQMIPCLGENNPHLVNFLGGEEKDFQGAFH